MTPDQIVAYYVALLIIQYNAKPKAKATIDTLITMLLGNFIIGQVQNAFNIETAVGAQLDILGKYVGAPRFVYNITLTGEFFQFRLAADPPPPTEVQNGFALASNPNTTWFWLTVQQIEANVTTLTDGQLRQLIQYLAQLESMDFTMENIDNLLFEYFGVYVTLVDHQNMTMTINHHASADPFPQLFNIVQGLNAFPRPAGVGLTITTT